MRKDGPQDLHESLKTPISDKNPIIHFGLPIPPRVALYQPLNFLPSFLHVYNSKFDYLENALRQLRLEPRMSELSKLGHPPSQDTLASYYDGCRKMKSTIQKATL